MTTSMTKKAFIGNSARLSILDSLAVGGADAVESSSLNRVARAGWRVCAKRNTSSRCLTRTSQLFVFHGVFRQIAKTDLPMEKANTRSMNRDIGTK
jgi:hypothetical protein